MKYAFSTLGCPRWNFDDIVSTAKDLGYNGVELRGVSDELYAPKIKAFNEQNLEKSLRKLTNLDVPMLTSNAVIALAEESEKGLTEFDDYLQLATKIGAKYIRVLCTNTAEPSGGDYDLAVKNYKIMLNKAENTGVLPIIETNGMFCNIALLAKFAEEVGDKCAILWDINHPYRFAGESMVDTVAAIGKWIKYVHIKDSVVTSGKCVYKMLGHGDLPIQEAVDALQDIGYDGYLSLEWVKRWNPDLEEPGIVFAQFIATIKDYVK